MNEQKPFRWRAASARAMATATAVFLSAGCTLDTGSQSGDAVVLVIGQVSKTINTATVGSLLKARHFLEDRLAEITSRTGTKYIVQWQDYDSGAQITAQMLAEKTDIGSIGDYPLLINGSKTQNNVQAATELISVAGSSAKGTLNMVVVPPDSPAATLGDLAGQKVSASVGSAGHGVLVRALSQAGIDPRTGVEVINQQPPIGASALESGQVQALSQFVAWPGLLVFQGKARLLYDGSELNYPTLHGAVIRRAYVAEHPEVVQAFLQAQLDAVDFLNHNPLQAAQIVSEGSGVPPEVVYLYNGPGGTSFDPRLRPWVAETLKNDVPYLKSIGDFADLDVDRFIQDGPLRAAYAERHVDYDAPSAAGPGALTGSDPVCNVAVTDPARAGELWLDGAATTQRSADPTCLLKAIRSAQDRGAKIRAAYVPDAELGTRWFADKSVWVRSGATFLPFTTLAGARRYLAAHPGAAELDYAQALGEAA